MEGVAYLSLGSISLLNGLDDSDGDGLPHVSDGESSKGRDWK